MYEHVAIWSIWSDLSFSLQAILAFALSSQRLHPVLSGLCRQALPNLKSLE